MVLRSRAGRWVGLLHVLSSLIVVAPTRAADWPMWHGDARRSGYSSERLPGAPKLQWVLDLPRPAPAWKEDEGRLRFDHHYEPVLLGGKLYVPSMVRDRLTCHDADSGAELWRFYADGPIRLAAAGWEGRVYFSCDDGYLYCLNADSGALEWRFRGGPADRMLIGNGRLISSWPARGAPVVRDATVYFAASIWPLMGVFIHAVDARSGERVWTNSSTGARFTVQQHSSPAFAGVSPQGYLVATPDHLVVPGGRTIPAVLRREDGAFLNFNLASRRMGTKGTGGYGVVAGDDFFIVEGGFYRITDGEFVAEVDATVLGNGELIGKDDKGPCIFAPRSEEVESTDRRGRTTKKVVIPTQWHSPLDAKIEEVFLLCGDRMLCRGRGTSVLAVDLPASSGEAVLGWSIELPDQPRSMIAGDGKLFVSTDAGRIYCFGERESSATLPPPRTVSLIARGARWKYRDGGEKPGAGWQSSSFSDAEWASGPAPLGYGSDVVATELSFGADPDRKPMTCYLRHDFEVAEDLEVDSLELRALVDDGAAFSINGRDVGRLFLPRGELKADSPAESGTDSRTYYRLKLRPDDVVPGTNTIAVEVHQVEQTSSDLIFDLELVASPPPPEPRWERIEDAWTTRAARILELSGARDGYCLAIGLGTGRLATELARQSGLHVIVLDPDRDRVDAFRRRLDDLGAYGTRIAAVAASFGELELPAYFAELVVAEDPDGAGIGRGASFAREVFHCLRPFSGTALFAMPEDVYGGFAAAVNAAKLDRGACSYENGHARLRRTAPPTGSAEWTHQHGDAANGAVSRDTVVKAPFEVLWFGGPSNADVLPRHGHGPAPQVVGGRLFIQGRDMLRATDIYTGRLLWQRELIDVGKYYDYTSHEPGANAIGGNYVSLRDGVYVLHRDRCLRLSPETGETLTTFLLPGAGENAAERDWGFLAVRDDFLIAGGWPTDFHTPEFSEADLSGLTGFWLRRAVGHIRELKDFEPLSYEEALALYPPPAEDGFRDEDDVAEAADAADSSSSGGGGFGWWGPPVVSDEEWRAHSEAEHRAYLVANVNRLLLDPDMVSRIPERQAFGRGGRGSGGGSGGREEQASSADAGSGASDGQESTGSGNESQESSDTSNDGQASNDTANDGTESNDTGADGQPSTGTGNGAGRGGRGRRRWPTMSEISAKLVQYLEAPGSRPNDRRALELKREVLQRRYRLPGYSDAVPGKFGNVARTGSRLLYALDRHSGEVRWGHRAEYEFRHSAIAVGRDAVFAIDRMSEMEASYHRRRGKRPNERASVVALDLHTGAVRWRSAEPVFGTWLGYSDEYDVLVQAGAHGPDRARDEARRGIVAYRGATGDVLWTTGKSYSGPCLLLGSRLITQGYQEPGFALDLLTGAPLRTPHPLSGAPLDWGYTRKYGCNTAIGSPNLLTFRSASAGYYDLLADCGTSNLGGIRSGCTSNLIPAGGILNAPDYTRTCTCAYQNQVSAAFIHDPDGSRWSFSPYAHDEKVVRRLGLNLGAPGDRRGPDGTLWLDLPSVGGESPDVPVEFLPDGAEFAFPSHHESWIAGGQLRWVAASALLGEGEIVVHLQPPDRELVIDNEVDGKSPLRISGAVLSDWVPTVAGNRPSTGAEAGKRVSVAGGFTRSRKFEAAIAGYPELAAESVTVEVRVQSDGDPVFVDAGASRQRRQGFVIGSRKPRVRYFVAVAPEEESEPDDESAGSERSARRRGRRDRREVTIESANELPRDRWSHVAFTYDAASGEGSLYVDGKLAGRDRADEARPLKWDDPAPALVVGDPSGGPARFAELRICSRALAPEEFLGGDGDGVGADFVIGHWRMDRAGREPPDARPYTVRLFFAELAEIEAGKRTFDVELQDERVLLDFDIAAAASGARRAIVREFVGVQVRESLRLRLTGARGIPLLSGIQLLAEW